MGLKNIVLSLFILACGGNTTGSSNDGSLDCKVNCMLDGGSTQKDGSVSNDACCRYDGSLDGSVDGSLDGSYDGNNNDGPIDVNVNDSSVDSNTGDGSIDGPINYPIAVLACNEWAEDGLCIHRPIKDQIYCWDVSGSLAGPGRSLVAYRIYPVLNTFPNFYVEVFSLDDLCIIYDSSGTFDAKARVIDDLGDFGEQEFYSIVSEN